MKKASKLHLPGYPTFGEYVYLGRVSQAVKKRAWRAGLCRLTARQFREKVIGAQAIERWMTEGTWFDTVRYPK